MTTPCYPGDCALTEALLQKAMQRGQQEPGHYARQACFSRAQQIKLLLLDVDGVLTDGSLLYDHQGRESKIFNARDGFGLHLVQQAGIQVGIISARQSEALRCRAEELHLAHLYMGRRDKLSAFHALLADTGLEPSVIAYMGDDWLDLPLLTRVGLAVCVADGAPEVRNIAHYTTRRAGGRGAVRELCDLLVEASGQKERLLAGYLQDGK